MIQLFYFLLYGLYVGLFLRLIYSWRFFDIAGVHKRHLAFFFLLKVVAGLGLTLIYTYYYTDQSKADIYRYFSDSKVISSVLFSHPVDWLKIMTGYGVFDLSTFQFLQNTWYFTHPAGDVITTNAFLIRVISVLNYFSGYNIYIDTLLLNCLTFTALTVLFKALRSYFQEFQQILYWPLFLMPSFVFWTSGLLKEGLMFIGISLYLPLLLEPSAIIKRSPSLAKDVALVTIIGLLSLLMVWWTKVYVAFALILCSVFLYFRNPGKYNKFSLPVRWIIVISILACGIYYIVSNPFCEGIINKRNEFIALAVAEHSGTNLETVQVDADCGHLAALLPSCIVNAVLRPFIWDKGNLFQILFAAENMVFMLALLGLLFCYFKVPGRQKRWLALFCFFFALVNYIGIGITIPILGAIVHYRVVALPFLLLAVLLMIDLEKLKLRLIRLFSFINFKS